jgi:hypothetical protein
MAKGRAQPRSGAALQGTIGGYIGGNDSNRTCRSRKLFVTTNTEQSVRLRQLR